MTESLPRGNFGPGPMTMPAILWYEFVLKENLLEEHLSQEYPDPSPTQLIIQFLQEAESQNSSLVTSNNNQNNTDSNESKLDVIDDMTMKSYNIKALKILALKVAAHLKWNLAILEKSVPLVLVQTLLTELLKATAGLEAENLKTTVPEFTTMSEDAAFATQLYHRWCVQSVVKDSFPSKPIRGPFAQVQMPFYDPIAALSGANEAVMKNLKEQNLLSVSALHQCVSCGKDLRMPRMFCFGAPNKKTETVEFRWDFGYTIKLQEYSCQISYDLGCHYFFQENYSKAGELFTKVQEILIKLHEPLYCCIPELRLSGYISACNSLYGTSSEPESKSISERVEVSKRNNYNGLVDILIDDNLKQELTLMYRSHIEAEIEEKNHSHHKLYTEVCVCNTVRGILEGNALVSRVLDALEEEDDEIMQFLLKVLTCAMKGASHSQRSNLRCFILHLFSLLPFNSRFSEMVINSELKSYLNTDDDNIETTLVEDIEDVVYKEITFDTESTECSTMSSVSRDSSSINLSVVEKQLLYIYDPDVIKRLILELIEAHGYQPKQITELNDEWKIPREFRMPLEKLSASVEQSYIFILLAKARHCITLKLYEKARLLFSTADAAVKDLSYVLSKHIRWQILLTDLQQYFHNESFGDSSSLQDLIKKTKTCLTSVRIGQEIQPSLEVLENCTAFLLNIREWDYLISMHANMGFIEISRLIASACKEITNLKAARKPARELWEAIIQIFMTNVQSKRTSSGRESALQRDAQFGLVPRDAFVVFLRKLKDVTVLGLFVSCLTKFYNILKDDITAEITSDYVAVWPAAITNVSSISINAVSDAVTSLMTHALEKHPHQPPWLKTQADLHFALGQYSPAMKNYMEAGVVASDYFSYGVPKNVFDDQVYKRMIKCCSYLQCHTQVAVLCQFLDEVDYNTAFKALQEKNTYDAMDTYYSCIWDTSMLEYLVHLHLRRGEMDKKQTAMRALSQLEINSNNPEEILQRAISVRKSKFLRSLAKQYVR